MDTTSHYSAYVFYLPEWSKEMTDAKENLADYYGISVDDIGTASVTGKAELSKAWNSIGLTEDGGNVSAVVIDTHGNASALGFGDENGDGTHLGSKDISNLENKNVDNLILLGCNSGHLDYKNTNPAAAFSKKVNNGSVLASDGTVFNVGRQGLLWRDYLYSSYNDGAFYRQLTGTRQKDGNWPVDNEGWIIYDYVNGVVNTTSFCNRYTLSINGLLNLMK